MTPRIVNLTTGEITPLQVVWSDTDHTPICECCGTYEPFCACEPETYVCDECGEVLTEEEVNANAEYDATRWLCDPCNERMWVDLWFNRSQEAQDHAVLRGWG